MNGGDFQLAILLLLPKVARLKGSRVKGVDVALNQLLKRCQDGCPSNDADKKQRPTDILGDACRKLGLTVS